MAFTYESFKLSYHNSVEYVHITKSLGARPRIISIHPYALHEALARGDIGYHEVLPQLQGLSFLVLDRSRTLDIAYINTAISTVTIKFVLKNYLLAS